MNRGTKLTTALAIGFAAAVMAQNPGDLSFRSKDGKFRLAPFSDFRIRQKQADLTFEGTGKGLTGDFEELSVQAERMTGSAVRRGNSFDLKTLDTFGASRATYRAANSKDTLNSTSAGIKYRVGTGTDTVDLTGAVVVTLSEPVISRNIRMEGKDAKLVIDPKSAGRDRLRSANLAGPVKIDLKQAAAGNRGATDIVATGNSLAYTASANGATLTLAGNVKVSGNGDSFSGDASAARLVVRFLASGEVDEVEMTGDPAETRLAPRGGGTRR